MEVSEKIKHLKESIGKVIIGKEDTVELLMVALLSKGHVLLEDVPGTGKTMLSKSLARSINGTFRRVQFTPDVLPSDISGIQYLNPKSKEFELKPGPVMTNILLADEINRATPRTQASLLEVMEERQVTIDGETLKLPAPFLVMATQNPIESQGTFPLPEAQMDRFLMRIKVGYPTVSEEKEIMRRYRKAEPIDELKPIFSLEEMMEMQELVKDVVLSEDVEDYMLEIIHKTRDSENVDVGVSPRGTLAFMRAVQSYALIKGKSYVTPQDVQTIAPHVLAHRIVLSLEGELRKSNQQVIEEIIEVVEVPVETGAVR
jgi:MoxR-like ATPase